MDVFATQRVMRPIRELIYKSFHQPSEGMKDSQPLAESFPLSFTASAFNARRRRGHRICGFSTEHIEAVIGRMLDRLCGILSVFRMTWYNPHFVALSKGPIDRAFPVNVASSIVARFDVSMDAGPYAVDPAQVLYVQQILFLLLQLRYQQQPAIRAPMRFAS